MYVEQAMKVKCLFKDKAATVLMASWFFYRDPIVLA